MCSIGGNRMSAEMVGSRVPRDRMILIAGMGTSPAVLTETVWAFAYQENELMYANYSRSCSGLSRNRKVAQAFRPRFHSSCRFDILLPAMLRQSFTDSIFATNTDGSGKAASYVRVLDMLGSILTKHYPTPFVGGSMRRSFSLADIHAFSRSETRPSSRRRNSLNWL